MEKEEEENTDIDSNTMDILPPITLADLGYPPRYVLQHQAISRAIQCLSVTARKLTAMAMAMLPADISSRTVAFSYPEFCNSLNIDKGGKSRKIFETAVDECMNCTIKIETPTKKPGKMIKEKYTWFSYAKIDESTGICTMHLGSEIASVLKNLKKIYTRLKLRDIGRLSSRYAIKLYEVSISYQSMSGEAGNRPGVWYWERSIPDLRELLAVPDGAYPKTQDLRRSAIDAPTAEINAAGLGLSLAAVPIRQGRSIVSIRINCTAAPRRITAASEISRATAAADIPEPDPDDARSREDRDLARLAELHQDEFAIFYTAELTAQQQRYGRVLLDQAAQAKAAKKLRDKYGIQK